MTESINKFNEILSKKETCSKLYELVLQLCTDYVLKSGKKSLNMEIVENLYNHCIEQSKLTTDIDNQTTLNEISKILKQCLDLQF